MATANVTRDDESRPDAKPMEKSIRQGLFWIHGTSRPLMNELSGAQGDTVDHKNKQSTEIRKASAPELYNAELVASAVLRNSIQRTPSESLLAPGPSNRPLVE